MKKIVSLILVLFLIASVLAGCSQKAADTSGASTSNEAAQNDQSQIAQSGSSENATGSSGSDDSLERVKQAGKITIGIDDAFPPLEFRDEKNQLVGYDIDLSREAAKRLGVEAEWIPTDWNGVILALNSKKFDIIWSGMSMTAERAKQVDFSPAYLNEAQVVVVKAKDDSIKTQEDLKGKIVGTQLGSTSEEAANKIEGLKELKKYSKFTEAFLDLANDRTQAIVVDELVGRYYMTKRPNEFKVAFPLVKEPIGIAFRKEDKALREALVKVLEEMKQDGTMAKISKEWFGEDISTLEDVKF
ncbi:MAG: transporter substrate-binding domain-containing protein [Tepidanaerobacteraceae bacterium]|nr:transporter substrate-binding domain-containing protein [Tepidanaerobacteraceae bacterium]